VTHEKTSGLAWCVDAFCEGNKQQPVEAIRTTTATTYTENGGDMAGFERSTVTYAFADEADVACPECGKRREVDVQERPQYPTSMFRQDGLLELIRGGLVKQPGEPLVPAAESERIAGLERELASMRELLEKANRPARRPAAVEPKDEAA
jgi:hypothetical protein